MSTAIKFGKPTVDLKKNTLVVTNDKEDFLNNAPDADEVKRVFNYIKDYSTALVEHAVDEAPKLFKKNKGAEEIIVKGAFGASKMDHLDVRIQKETSSRNPSDGSVITQPRISTKMTSRSFPGKTFLKDQKNKLVEAL